MSRRSRGALAAVAAVAALAPAGSALAANTGTVGVSIAGSTTTIHVSIPQSTDPTAQINIFVPAGFTASLGQSAGATVGSIPSATAYSYDTSLTLPLTGAVVVSSLDQVGAASYQPCIGSATPAAVWLLHLSVAGQTLDVPMYVFQTSGAQAALGSYKLTTCLPPPDVPAGTPGRASFGAQLLDAEFTLNGVLTGPATARWETAITPYTPKTGQVDAAGTFEAQSIPGSGTVTLTAKLNRKTHVVALKGRVGGGSGSVTIYRGSTAVATATASGGSFATTLRVKGKAAVTFKAKVKAAESQTTCTPALPATVAPAGCASATIGAFSATSKPVTVKP